MMPAKTSHPRPRRHAPSTSDDNRHAPTNVKRALLRALAPCLLLVALPALARAQASRLPTPDKIVADYIKAVGGRKRLAALRDATYEWSATSRGAEAGWRARN
ncbi:MAG: hypothetical protein DMF67_00070 [Acidobacteria bacterium]|nr:MAG: hypothetical protein DMF67_00070 [Acidobacteriota bacterium]